ncbi:extracellular solute-binding protein [Streptomyces sp. MD20-1-1]|uniref:ABC transporter substrate-binding protein n=1 Tax=Streptomyces sp. MD20-1-1 TaxID=3028668 RepID=UPI0029B23862|nr:extracellular solute-binding protein [Streptomyces sp. MD20-1-1]
MRRRTAALALGTAAAMVLTGCSTMSPGESGTVTLNMVESLTNPARTDLLEELIADFEEKNPKVKVNLVSPPTEQADQKLQQMLQSGSGVDVLEVRDITVGPWSNNGWLYDMKKDLAGWKGWDALTRTTLSPPPRTTRAAPTSCRTASTG